ncbi:transposase, partial [Catenibacterium faecis]|uniref:transposase n=1 Tax=Catenibacterium faecis TaxID=2764323 RepID=UPI003F80E89B
MNECLNNEPNYISYYNSIQMCLPLGLGYEITPTDELLSFLEAIKGVDLSKYMVRKETRGRKGHNRIDLLRAELFAYMKLGHPTLRELEYQCRRNLDFMFLTKELCPSSKAFERLEKSYLKASIEDIFYDISAHIGSLMGARTDIQYIDGTK